jgi:cytochrome c peroxidase
MLLLSAAIAIPLGLDFYLPVHEENPLTVEGIEQGRRLFFDRRLSRDNSISTPSAMIPNPPSPTARLPGQPSAIAIMLGFGVGPR